MNDPDIPGLFTSWGCGRCKAQGMKLWSFTANACNEADAERSARLKGKICMHKIVFITTIDTKISLFQ